MANRKNWKKGERDREKDRGDRDRERRKEGERKIEKKDNYHIYFSLSVKYLRYAGLLYAATITSITIYLCLE